MDLEKKLTLNLTKTKNLTQTKKKNFFIKEYLIFIILFVNCFILLLSLFSFMYIKNINLTNNKVIDSKINITYLTRENINSIIEKIIEKEGIYKIEEFYNYYTKNSYITNIILSLALLNKIPVNLFFAICWKESNFNPKAKNKNANGSEDYGLFQLNSFTYKNYKKEELYDIKINVFLATKHFLEDYEYCKDYIKTLIYYNAGKGVENNKIPIQTINYVIDILELEEKLNFDFYNKFLKGE